MVKKVPRFWWDFTSDMKWIIVESEHPKYPIIRKFNIKNYRDISNIVKTVEIFIKDLEAGRISIKKGLKY